MFNLLKSSINSQLKKYLNKDQKPIIVILTGAGISAESGIETFRGINGLWNGENIEEVCTPYGFEKDPKKVIDFYNQRRSNMLNKESNDAHKAITELQKAFEDVYVITQNVDNLHEKAGNKNCYHIHGSLLFNKCHICGFKEKATDSIELPNKCLRCQSENFLRPDIVFFKEQPYFTNESQILANNATIFITIGTSGVVYPAAYYVRQAYYNGACTIQINIDPQNNNIFYDITLKDKATKAVPTLVKALILHYKKK